MRRELAALQSAFPYALPLRMVDPAKIHFTLQFLGDTPASKVPELLAALASLPTHPIRLFLHRVGVFPNQRRPQVLWVGLGGELPELQQRYKSLVAATGALGFPPEARPFRPHLTIARVRNNLSPEAISALRQAITALPAPQAVPWQAERPELIQSTLTPQGPIYRRIEDTG